MDALLGRRVPAGPLAAIESLVLGAAAAILVLFVIPHVFGIEWACVGPSGAQRVLGDGYAGAFVVIGTFGWIGVLVATIYAAIAGRSRLVVLLPALWFLALVSGALVAAAFIGPERCPV